MFSQKPSSPTLCEQNTHSNSKYRCAQCVTTITEQNDHISLRDHAWLKIAHLCVSKKLSSTCHVTFLAAPHTDHNHKFSLTYLTYFSPSHPSLLAHDPYLPCEDSRHSGRSTQTPFLTSYGPKVIEPEDLEPGRIELERNLGTDPYRTQERIMGENYPISIAEDVDEFGKVGVEMSYL